jgi:hypothetical protein
MIKFNAKYSRRVLLQLIGVSIVVGFVILINIDYIRDVYLRNQVTSTGYIVNGSILALFGLGLFRIISLLLRYNLEERALVKFLHNIETDEVRPVDNISNNSLIHRRYTSVLEISKHNVAVNHSALA